MSAYFNFFLSMHPGEYAIIIVESKTGILLKPNGDRYFDEENESPLMIKKSLEDAKNAVRDIISQNLGYDLSIFDYKNELIEFYPNQQLGENVQKAKKKWWKFW